MDATTTPTKLPTTKQVALFKEAQDAEDDADDAELQREHDTKIDLLIGRKNHQRLRVCGYEVHMIDPNGLPLTTTDERSL